MEITKEFKVASVRTVKSPSDSGIKTYFVWVNFNDLPSDISLEVNPRKPKMNTQVARQLIKAVTDQTTVFDINNRGIVITAKSVAFDTSNSILKLNLGTKDDEKLYGILDGGHTYKAITEHRAELDEDIDKFVRLEIIVGENLDVSGLADARNTSTQVSDIALYELDDKFDFIKNAIEKESYADDVAYKDNDKKTIPVANLIKFLYAFNIERFPDDTQAPTSAYSSKLAVFNDYKKSYDKEPNIYKQIADKLPRLIELYETIQKEIGGKYQSFKNADGKNAKFGGVRGVSKKEGAKTDFTQQDIDYDVSVGFLMPIFGAFRALLKRDQNGEIDWSFDPIEVWNSVGESLVQNTFDTDTNPQQIGKNKTLWQANYRIVDGERKDLLLKKLMENQ
jgi:hypothetical protein